MKILTISLLSLAFENCQLTKALAIIIIWENGRWLEQTLLTVTNENAFNVSNGFKIKLLQKQD